MTDELKEEPKKSFYEKDIQHLLCKINRVTCPHRHHNKVRQEDLDELANAQIEFEKKYGYLGGNS